MNFRIIVIVSLLMLYLFNLSLSDDLALICSCTLKRFSFSFRRLQYPISSDAEKTCSFRACNVVLTLECLVRS